MKQINVAGLPVTVGTPAELEPLLGEESIHLVVRVADATGPRSPDLQRRRFKVPCADCRELCWCDPASVVNPTALILCFRCLAARLKAEEAT